MRHSIGLAAIIFLLTGCATTADQAAQAERDADRMMQVYGPACKKLGFAPDTDPWRNCIIGLSRKDSADRNYDPFYGGPHRYSPYWW